MNNGPCSSSSTNTSSSTAWERERRKKHSSCTRKLPPFRIQQVYRRIRHCAKKHFLVSHNTHANLSFSLLKYFLQCPQSYCASEAKNEREKKENAIVKPLSDRGRATTTTHEGMRVSTTCLTLWPPFSSCLYIVPFLLT